ncbi:MAG: DUF1828 domain-containing protein, partial [Armatimonadetes bacterium]|nr:DUF1828 domain-containing protein [Armatimonadota bacterium]
MRTQISSFISEYWDWLKNKTVLQEIDDWVEVTTPYLDRHNDYLQVYIKQESSQIVITDDGYVINDLRLSGCEFDTPRRKALLSIATQGYGVQVEKEALIVHATRESFPLKKHNLIQAMLAVNDLFYVASTS